MMTHDEALEYAQDVYDERRFHEGFDWKEAVTKLVESNMFTASQAAQIVNVTKTYVQKYIRDSAGTATNARTRGGVAGKFNPESLIHIRMARVKTANRNPRTAIPEDVRQRLKVALDEGNGATLVAHLTGLNVGTVREIGREDARS